MLYLGQKINITLGPTSTRLAKFCNALAMSFSVLAAVSEGFSDYVE